jgi:hypothetical protein
MHWLFIPISRVDGRFRASGAHWVTYPPAVADGGEGVWQSSHQIFSTSTERSTLGQQQLNIS